MTYFHTDIFTHQSSKIHDNPCGDVYGFIHETGCTTLILSDGLGSGIKANIAANLCVSRFIGLIKAGAGFREAFSALVKSMNISWGTNEPFSTFSVARILNNGNTTLLSYENPLPLLINRNSAAIAIEHRYKIENALITEGNGNLAAGEGLIMMSDGITEAGTGKGMPYGWTSEGVASFLNKQSLQFWKNGQAVADQIHTQARNLWGQIHGDDCSVVFARLRKGIIVNLLSGPPAENSDDVQIISDFIATQGIKVICGGTTSNIASKILKKKLVLGIPGSNSMEPPAYQMEGIHLVTEGIVTLNQVNNLLDWDTDNIINDDSPVYALLDLLKTADKVNLFVGKSKSVTENDLAFRQQGIMPRLVVLQAIERKLISQGKLVLRTEY